MEPRLTASPSALRTALTAAAAAIRSRVRHQGTTAPTEPRIFPPRRPTITVNTRQYEVAHGKAPRQSRAEASSGWAFHIDEQEITVLIYASYATALRQAKAMAQQSVTVLP